MEHLTFPHALGQGQVGVLASFKPRPRAAQLLSGEAAGGASKLRSIKVVAADPPPPVGVAVVSEISSDTLTLRSVTA